MTIRNKGLSSQQTLTWDAEDRLKEISGGGLPAESYLYDADGARIKKTSNGVSTYYISPLFEVTGSAETRYYYFNGQRVAMHNNSPATNGVYTYLHTDHLGSTVLTTDTTANTNPSSDQRYYAYGKQRDLGPVVTDHQFTGQKVDGSGLYYYNARYYDPLLGTFISPDTIVPDPGTLIDYNRYAYSRANPLRFVDPSGYDPLDTAWQEEFYKNHRREPNQNDIRGRLFSLVMPGSGFNGTWTSGDWDLFARDFVNFFNGDREWPNETVSPGLNRFAARVDKLSSYYAVGEERNFVRAAATLFGGLDYLHPAMVSLLELKDAVARTVILPHLKDGTDGWGQGYLEPGDDPGHHFIGLFYAGYFYGRVGGHFVNAVRDPVNPPDLILGAVGVEQGVRFAQGDFSMYDLDIVIRIVGSRHSRNLFNGWTQ